MSSIELLVRSGEDARQAAGTRVGTASKSENGKRPRLVLLSTSALTGRVLLHTGLLEALSERASARVWANPSLLDAQPALWNERPADVQALPEIHPYREFPYNLLRRVNDYAWDFRIRPPSKMSIWKHLRRYNTPFWYRAMRGPGRVVAALRLEEPFEKGLERVLLSFPRSPEAVKRLAEDRPSLLVVMAPFQATEPAVVAAAKRLGIPTLALIPSWDNPSTKNRMVFRYDGYIVWSENEREDLHRFFPYTREAPIYIVGPPQFDTFFDERFRLSRADFCAMEGLQPDRPIIVHAIGSPNFLQEHHAALHLAERVAAGALGDVQLVVRPHPIHDNQQMTDLFRRFGSRVVLQHPKSLSRDASRPGQDVLQWVNTFRYADVVVNLASTVTIDAAIFDRPVVNLDYDPEPGRPNQLLVHDVNHLWTHFKPIAESGGVWNVRNDEELVAAVQGYLAHPEKHREERAAMVRYVCGRLDGRSGERMAAAILDFAGRQKS